MDLAELLQLELHVENGFAGALKGAVPQVNPSQSSETAKTPRIDLKAVIGAVHGQRKLLTSGREMFNVWNGQLQTTAVTNRTSERRSEAHNRMLGEIRARCQRFAILPEWNKYSEAILLMDIREDGTEDSVEDSNDLDKTQINWQILFSLDPAAIPNNI